MRLNSGSKVIPFHTVPPVPVFHHSPVQVLAAASITGSPLFCSGEPGTVKKRHSCLPVCRIERGDKAARAEVRAGVADDHLAVHRARRAGADVEHALRDALRDPEFLAGLRIERDQAAIQRGDEDFALLVRDAAVRAEREVHRHRIVLPRLRIVLPEQLARRCLDRVDGRIAAAEKDHAVDRQRRRFQRDFARQVQRPREAEAADGIGIDLVKAAETGLVRCAAGRGPVRRPRPLGRRLRRCYGVAAERKRSDRCEREVTSPTGWCCSKRYPQDNVRSKFRLPSSIAVRCASALTPTLSPTNGRGSAR